MTDNWLALDIPAGSRIFAPLCGKSKDMAWLMEQGYQVLGVELSEIAARSFLEESGLEGQRDLDGPFVRGSWEYEKASRDGLKSVPGKLRQTGDYSRQ